MTAFSLFVIVRPFNAYFGLPKPVLTSLSGIAICLFIYSAACYVWLKGDLKPYLRFVGIANLSYCALTIGLLIHYSSLLTILGIAYFLVEIVIICALSYVELKVATKN